MAIIKLKNLILENWSDDNDASGRKNQDPKHKLGGLTNPKPNLPKKPKSNADVTRARQDKDREKWAGRKARWDAHKAKRAAETPAARNARLDAFERDRLPIRKKPKNESCEDCGGHGWVVTPGSHRMDNERDACPTCSNKKKLSELNYDTYRGFDGVKFVRDDGVTKHRRPADPDGERPARPAQAPQAAPKVDASTDEGMNELKYDTYDSAYDKRQKRNRDLNWRRGGSSVNARDDEGNRKLDRTGELRDRASDELQPPMGVMPRKRRRLMHYYPVPTDEGMNELRSDTYDDASYARGERNKSLTGKARAAGEKKYDRTNKLSHEKDVEARADAADRAYDERRDRQLMGELLPDTYRRAAKARRGQAYDKKMSLTRSDRERSHWNGVMKPITKGFNSAARLDRFADDKESKKKVNELSPDTYRKAATKILGRREAPSDKSKGKSYVDRWNRARDLNKHANDKELGSENVNELSPETYKRAEKKLRDKSVQSRKSAASAFRDNDKTTAWQHMNKWDDELQRARNIKNHNNQRNK